MALTQVTADVLNNSQGNITSVGTLANLTVSGNISADYFLGNGALLTGIVAGSNYGNTNVAAYLTANPQSGTYSNTNVAAYLPTYTGNIGAHTVNGNITVTSGNYFLGNGALLTGIVAGSNYGNTNVAAYLTANPQSGTYTNTNVSSYLTSATISTSSTITASTVSDSKGNLRDFALNTQSTAYTLVLADDSKLINTTANVVIPTGIFSAGQTVTIFNNSSSNINITSGATVYSAGTNLTGNRILAQRGLSTVVCVASNTFVISGAGLY